jgi:phosphoribosylformylglycinamidine synthase subunit PurL
MAPSATAASGERSASRPTASVLSRARLASGYGTSLVSRPETSLTPPSSPAGRIEHLSSAVGQPVHRALGLTDEELDRIVGRLEREPNHFELAVFSLLWSEHCGYKHSARLLRRLPSSGERVLQGPGENAGVLDLGEGLAVAFKVESHNHPSAVEPFQGAATGVGGILRDVVAMGARPIALLDGLRFGANDWHFSRAVGGISHYGNCTGIATVGGEVVFDEAYADNCLVNAMCVGLLPVERLMSARATGAGALVVLYGATTGRDGIGGASVLASQELGDESAEKRPSVQIGDPFTGKKLIEVSVELVERGLVDSLQDCGAAGLASSLAEMAADYGIDVHLDRVPLREEGMEPWEVMISESQERMVAIVARERLAAVQEVCDRWELHHAVVGAVTDTGELRAYWEDELVGAIRARHLTDDCPRYAVARQPRPAPPDLPLRETPPTGEALLELLGSDALRSRRFVYRRYDLLVQSRTVRRPGLDAAVLRLRPSYRGLAVTLDGTGRIGALDPFTGGALAVLEAARNVACVGGEPLGVTDCLNFGNPEKPEIGWELAEAIEGIAQACAVLGVPVVSGNVSLYNDTAGHSIPPTPVVGCVGLVPDVRRVPGGWQPGDTVYLASTGKASLAGSEYQARYGTTSGAPPALDLPAEAALVGFLASVAPDCTLVHDSAEGGLAVALAEAALWSGCGAELELTEDAVSLFGEGPGQAILAVSAGASEPEPPAGVELRRLGTAGGATLLGVGVDRLRAVWERD